MQKYDEWVRNIWIFSLETTKYSDGRDAKKRVQ